MNIQKIAGYVIVVALLVMLTGLLVVSQNEQPLTETPATPTATPPLAASVTQTRTLDQEIALCTFAPQTQALPDTLPLDTFVFSEPQVVLTSTTAIRLLQWLPDGQHLLISRAMTGVAKEYIETFDLSTKEIERYAERLSNVGNLVWLPAEQAVAFVDLVPPDYTRVLYLGHGGGLPVEELATDLVSSLLSLSPDGQSVIYFSNARGMQLLRLQTFATESPTFGWAGRTDAGRVYGSAWRADGDKAVMYGKGGFYLVDQSTGATCEIDLGKFGGQKIWAIDAKWSPAGQYIAALLVAGEAPFRLISLMTIDTITGEFQNTDFEGRSVHSIDWLPNDDILLVTVDADTDPLLASFDSLYLVEASTNNSRPILPEHQFFAASYFGALWSPDGKTIGLACSDVVPSDEVIEWRLCTTIVGTQR